jgi:hypothetical protein
MIYDEPNHKSRENQRIARGIGTGFVTLARINLGKAR